MPRWLKTIIVILILAGLGYLAYQRFAPHDEVSPDMAAGGPPPAMPVSVAKVVARDVQVWNDFSGRLTAVDHAEIRPRVSGVIEAMHFTEGAVVNKGDLLFTIDQKPYIAEVDRAQGALASAQAQAKLAHKDDVRAEGLLKEKAIAKRDYDQRRSDVTVADANVKSAQAALETAQLNLDYTQIKAPISGRVSRAEITVGNLVETGSSAPVLTTIVSSNPIYADFEIDEVTFLHYVGATAGDVTKLPAELGLATETGTPHTGHIASFDNRLNAASGTIRVRAVFDNPDGLLVPGMFARMLLGTAAPAPALLITDRAVGTDQNKKFVLVVGDDNKVAYREVRLGPLADGLRIVEEGLKADEKIVVSGLQRARPGAEVVPEVVAMDAPPAPPGGPPPAAKPAPEKAPEKPAEAPAEPAKTPAEPAKK